MNNTNLYKRIISKQNIYNSIYALESYIFDIDLLNKKDKKLYFMLKDKFNFKVINSVINKCINKINEVLSINTDKFFDIKVYYKIKKYDFNEKKYTTRPIYTANLVTQISIVAILNVLMFDDNSKRKLSDLSKIIPENFYGNIPATQLESIFYNWRKKYKEYSDITLECYKKYKNTKEYNYEVSLDFKNFFPTINPEFIKAIIKEKLSILYEDEEYNLLDKILDKLLYFNVTNADHSYYNGENHKNKFKNIENIQIGIPQGLPQAYYFGNICMVYISQIINNEFNGKSFYYVDDSVIYTNEVLDNEKFKDKIESINERINSFISDYLNEEKINNDYKIEINREKSSFLDISGNSKPGIKYLKNINNGVSSISLDMMTALDEPHEEIALEKIEMYLKAIDKELNSLDINDNVNNYYIKMLKRTNKYFLYRFNLLEFKNNNKDNESNNEIYLENKLKEITDNVDKESQYNKFEEKFIETNILFFKNYLTKYNDKSLQKKFYDMICDFEKKLLLNENNLYYSKILKFDQYRLCEYTIYDSIKIMNNSYINNFQIVSNKNKLELISEIILNIKNNKNNEVKSKNYFGYNLEEYCNFVFENSDYFKKIILNVLFSKIFNVEISNKFEIFKFGGKTLEYFELRILCFIRNNTSTYEECIDFIEKNSKEVNLRITYDKIDYSILEVIDIFHKFVRDRFFIDNLIVTHKYIMQIWRNGSKNLYFYTLHNQEHSTELIKYCVDLCKNIDFIKIKKIDYYILFLACYLHDISMVIQPELNTFILDKDKAEKIYIDWKKELTNICTNNSIDEKKFILKYYKILDNYFENYVRDNHVESSAKFVKKSAKLPYINELEKEIVCYICESHGFYATDVYSLKSKGRDSAVNIKFLMILLRFADLMDMSKDRVSLDIMKLNIKNMSETSKFHWISHSIIDKCEIKTNYKYSNPNKDEPDTYIKNEFFEE